MPHLIMDAIISPCDVIGHSDFQFSWRNPHNYCGFKVQCMDCGMLYFALPMNWYVGSTKKKIYGETTKQGKGTKEGSQCGRN